MRELQRFLAFTQCLVPLAEDHEIITQIEEWLRVVRVGLTPLPEYFVCFFDISEAIPVIIEGHVVLLVLAESIAQLICLFSVIHRQTLLSEVGVREGRS